MKSLLMKYFTVQPNYTHYNFERVGRGIFFYEVLQQNCYKKNN